MTATDAQGPGTGHPVLGGARDARSSCACWNRPASMPRREAVERELDRIDLACSRFRPDSELSRLNARAGRSTAAGPLLVEALELALRAAELTGGDVDPTVGRALELAGYDRDWKLLDPPVR